MTNTTNTDLSLRLTAGDIVARIQSAVGVPWREPTCDTFKSGFWRPQ